MLETEGLSKDRSKAKPLLKQWRSQLEKIQIFLLRPDGTVISATYNMG